jgi:predicted dehydrogenase
MEKLTAAVIGLGMGCAHLRGYQKHPGVEVIGIVDPDEGRLSSVGDEFSIANRYASAEQLFEALSPDIVSIAVPNVYHKPLSLLAFEHGAHVLCEKPMAMNAAEAEEMLSAAEAAGKRLMINFSFRFTPQSQALKREVDSGILGDVYFGRTVWHRRRGLPRFGGWFGKKELSGGGPLIDLGVHRLDLALWLMGYPTPVWVMGATYDPIARQLADKASIEYTVEDLAAAFIRFEGGATLVVEASWAANIAEKELMITRLLGTKAGLVQRNVAQGYDFEAEIYLERDGSQFDMQLSKTSPDAKSAMEHFADAIIDGTPHIATGAEGLVVMKLLDSIYASAESGEPVRVG